MPRWQLQSFRRHWLLMHHPLYRTDAKVWEVPGTFLVCVEHWGIECESSTSGFLGRTIQTYALQIFWALVYTNMGGCQKYGPFLGTLSSRCRIILGTQKLVIILTTTHILSFGSIVMLLPDPQNSKPYGYSLLWVVWSPRHVLVGIDRKAYMVPSPGPPFHHKPNIEKGLGFRGLGFRVWDLGLRVQGSGSRA